MVKLCAFVLNSAQRFLVDICEPDEKEHRRTSRSLVHPMHILTKQHLPVMDSKDGTKMFILAIQNELICESITIKHGPV